MIVYRLAKGRFRNDLSGKGAEIAGGRWNNKGIPMLYTSESRALCLVEVCVHLPLTLIPDDYYMVMIDIPNINKIDEVLPENLPENWISEKNYKFTQKLGDKFIITNKFLALKVPSASVPGDFNILINPKNKDFCSIKIVETVPFCFDSRLFNLITK